MPRHHENARIRTTWLRERSEHKAPKELQNEHGVLRTRPTLSSAAGWRCPTGGLGQGSPNKERSPGGWGRLTTTLLNPSPPRSVHPLPPALGGGLGDPRSPWSDLSDAGPRSPDQTAAENSLAPTSRSSDDRPTCTPHRFRFGASYPHFAIFIRAPAPRRSWDGDWRPQLLPLDSAARQPPRGSLGPRDAGAGL